MTLICDHCSSPVIAWDYPCEDFEMTLPDGRTWVSKEGWIACAECAAVIERNELPIAHTFCIQRLEALHGKTAEAWIEKVKRAQALFLEHRSGPRASVENDARAAS